MQKGRFLFAILTVVLSLGAATLTGAVSSLAVPRDAGVPYPSRVHHSERYWAESTKTHESASSEELNAENFSLDSDVDFALGSSTNLTIEGTGKPARLSIEPPLWKWVRPGVQVGPRAWHSLTCPPELGRAILFGGSDGLGATSESWSFDLLAGEWNNDTKSGAPTARSGHIAIPIGGTFVLLFGGLTGNPQVPSNETWLLDAANMTWSLLNPISSPGPRFHHSAAVTGAEEIVIFGGLGSGNRLLNDTWTYNRTTNSWKELQVPGRPAARASHSLVTLGDGLVLLYGGANGQTLLSDSWLLDSQNHRWIKLFDQSPPGPRQAHSMSWDFRSGRALLFGGLTVGGPSDDFWFLHRGNLSWSRSADHLVPSPRYSHAMCTSARVGRSMIYGGLTTFPPNERNNETWVYPFGPTSGLFESATLVLPPFARWSGFTSRAEMENHTVLRFQVATNEDNVSWKWLGPDGLSESYYLPPGRAFWDGVMNRPFLKIRAFLSTDAPPSSPHLDKIVLNYTFVPPEIVESRPPHSSTGVPKDAKIEILFSQPMNASSVERAIGISPGLGWSSTWNSNNTRISVLPTSTFPPGIIVRVAVGETASAVTGLHLVRRYEFSFTVTQVELAADLRVALLTAAAILVVFASLVLLVIRRKRRVRVLGRRPGDKNGQLRQRSPSR